MQPPMRSEGVMRFQIIGPEMMHPYYVLTTDGPDLKLHAMRTGAERQRGKGGVVGIWDFFHFTDF